MGITQSAYSYWLHNGKNSEEKTISLYQKIIEIYSRSKGIYGAPKICAELNAAGYSLSVATVSRAMKRLGIRSIVAEKFSKKKTKLAEHEKKHIINLIKGLEINTVNQVWTTDITYIKTVNEGSYYLISYIDYYSKRVVSWDLRRQQKADDMIEVLKDAVAKRDPAPGLIVHSDKGSQMRSEKYREYLKKNNFVVSYTSLDHACDENAAQESFHSLLKKEWIYQRSIHNYEEAYSAIKEYIEDFYNTVRIHSSIGYMSPIDFENKLKKSP